MRTSPLLSEPGSQRLVVMIDRPLRTAASGPCRCNRHTCGHAGECHSGGVVRFLRNSRSKDVSSVVLCRECAAPHTSQSRGAVFLSLA
jgi:hypothetical protein